MILFNKSAAKPAQALKLAILTYKIGQPCQGLPFYDQTFQKSIHMKLRPIIGKLRQNSRSMGDAKNTVRTKALPRKGRDVMREDK
jgi:hypothetical protein